MSEDKNAGQPGPAFVDFGKHVLLVTAVFVIIFAVAIGLDLLARYLVVRGVLVSGSYLEFALRAAKYFLLAVDLLLLVVLVVKFGWRLIKKL